MTFPQFNSKHKEQALFSPRDFIEYKRWDSRGFPKKIIIVYQKSALNHFKREYGGRYEKIRLLDAYDVFKYGNTGLIRMTGIGSPHAVTLLEELIAAGANEFLSIGTAGGLIKPGVFLCNKAVRDEGTSHHYIPHGKYAFPDKELTRKFKETLVKQGVEFTIAPTWTIDAPYRETKAEVDKYSKEGIATVEMEASALFSVAKLRKVKIASAFVVSDVLGDKWEPNFHKIDVKRSLNKLVDASLVCLGGKR